MVLAKVRGMRALPLLKSAQVPTVMEDVAETEVTETTFGNDVLDRVSVGQYPNPGVCFPTPLSGATSKYTVGPDKTDNGEVIATAPALSLVNEIDGVYAVAFNVTVLLALLAYVVLIV
jgi:hypothetical protein